MNAQCPLVSCVVLTYKKFDYLYDALESILNQDYPEIELIISDDGSDKLPEREIKEFIKSKKQENLKLFQLFKNSINKGIVKNYNEAIKLSKGKYILGLSGDDIFYEISTLRKIVFEFERSGADILSCRRMICEADKTAVGLDPLNSELKKIMDINTPEKQFKALATRRYSKMFCGASLYYRNSYLKKKGFFDESYKYVEDYTICLQHIKEEKQVRFVEDIVSIWYRKGGVSTNIQTVDLLADDNRRIYEIEIKPLLKTLNILDRRYAKFVYLLKCCYYRESCINKIKFVFKYIDMCILSRCYKCYDKFNFFVDKIDLNLKKKRAIYFQKRR